MFPRTFDLCLSSFRATEEASREMKEKKSVSMSLRFTEREWHRIQEMIDIAKTREHYVKAIHILKELMGLLPPAALTEEDIERFRTRPKEIPTQTLRRRKSDATNH